MSLTQAEFDVIRRIVRERCGVALEAEKVYLAESRLADLVIEAGLPSLTALVDELRGSPCGALASRVVEAMVTNETQFFRDGVPFAALRSWILPALVHARQRSRQLVLWSAAAASGQEAYSLAMLLHDHFALPGWDVRILASDVSMAMVRRAEDALYGQLEVNRGLPAALLVRHFVREGLEWRLRPEIRERVEVRRINLAEPWPDLPPVDVLLLRNVMIYFDAETKREVLRRVRQVLVPDGYLILGGVETTLGLDDAFEWVPGPVGGCFRLKARREEKLDAVPGA